MSALSDPDCPKAYIPVFQIVRESYQLIWKYRLDLLALFWCPFLIALLCLISIGLFFPTPSPGYLLLGFVGTYIWVPMMTGWQRLLLLGEMRRSRRQFLKIGKREFYFFGLCLFLNMVVGVLLFIGSRFPYGDWISAVVIVWVLARSCLMLPAMAVQADEHSSVIVDATKGYVFKIIWLFFVTASFAILPLGLLTLTGWFILTLFPDFLSVGVFYGGNIIIAATTGFLISVGLAVFSLVYRQCRERIEWLEEQLLFDRS